ncbi:hypothetical protein H8356DRAFT_1298932 [Neocallimastix lanati (nom. inval.)]|nr:hypothetical protein H8356DRAFT_1298932 [Neocallimastix sp. JGI-2020a]
MEENLIIDISESNKGKEQIIIYKKYSKKYDVSLSIMKHKIKDGIEKTKLFKKYNDDIFVDVKNDNNIFIYYKTISSLPFINPEYIFDIYVIIKIKSIKNNYCQFLKFLEYFYKTSLVGYDIKIWNYYNNMEHITNNASESLNNYLNNLFPTKPSFL